MPVVAASRNHPLLDGVVALVPWLIYECSDNVEQRVIPGGRLTDVDTRNSYIVAQYLASHEALLRAFTDA